MKTSTIITAIVTALSFSAPGARAEADAVLGGIMATCWDFAINGNYLYATCSSGGSGSPAIRSAVDISKFCP
jgi:uncharacterized membrane protein